MKKRWLRFLLGLLLSAAALWLATRHVDWSQAARALRSADYALLLAALLLQVGSFGIVAVRWRAFFPDPAALSVRRLVEILLVAQLVNAAAPLRLGPLARAYLAGDEGRTVALTTVAGEKLLDLLALLLALMLALLLLPLPAWLQGAGLGLAALAAAGLAALLLATGGRRQIERWLPRLGSWLAGVSLALLDTLAAWLRPARLARLAGWTVALWAAGVGVNLLVLRAFGLPARLAPAWTLLVLLQLGARVPGAPGNVGVFESLCVAGLGWFGVEPGPALSYGLALHAVVLLPGLVGGGWVLWRDAALRTGLRQAANAAASPPAGSEP